MLQLSSEACVKNSSTESAASAAFVMIIGSGAGYLTQASCPSLVSSAVPGWRHMFATDLAQGEAVAAQGERNRQ